MSKQIARLLKTDMMSDLDLKSLAQLLRSRGRGNDKILAHITAREAKRLKDEGGSGTINPDTGLPEYYDGDMGEYVGEPAQIAQNMPDLYADGQLPAPGYETTFSPREQAEAPPAVSTQDYSLPPSGATYGLSPVGAGQGFKATPQQIRDLGTPSQYVLPQPSIDPSGAVRVPQPQASTKDEKPGFLESLTTDQMIRLGLGAGTGLVGAQAAKQAAEQAKQAKGEISALGAPYQQTGKSMQDAALRGELTPAGQQQVAAARAQLAQGIEKRGGVGAAQAATQLAQFRQNLLDQQYNYGLKVAQIGDSYAQKAIQTGLTQDKELVALMQGLTGAFGGFMGNQPNQPVASTPPRA
jgi:hypothetical protein